MKIAVISDIHGNRIALEACHSMIRRLKCNYIVCLGDTVGYYPDALACLKMLNDNGITCLMGNHEAMLLGLLPVSDSNEEIYKLADTKKHLSPKDLNKLVSRLPFLCQIVDKQKILFVHGSPWDPLNGYIYLNMDTGSFSSLGFDLVFCGHTHRPFIKRENQTLVVNAGSCGLPRDNGSLSSFAVYDTLSGKAEIIRIPIDSERIINEYVDVHFKVKECLQRREKAYGNIILKAGEQ